MDLEIKQHIRDFFDGKTQPEREKARMFNTIPALIIRDVEMEHFINGSLTTVGMVIIYSRAMHTGIRDFRLASEWAMGRGVPRSAPPATRLWRAR